MAFTCKNRQVERCATIQAAIDAMKQEMFFCTKPSIVSEFCQARFKVRISAVQVSSEGKDLKCARRTKLLK